MGGFALFMVLSPLIVTLWFGAGWLITHFWKEININIAMGKNASETASERTRRGY